MCVCVYLSSCTMLFLYTSKSCQEGDRYQYGKIIALGSVTFSRGEFHKLSLRKCARDCQCPGGRMGKETKSPSSVIIDLYLFVFSTWDSDIRSFPIFPENKFCDFTGRLDGMEKGPGDSDALLFQQIHFLVVLFLN